MSDPPTSALKYLGDAPQATRAQIRADFIAWLLQADHQHLQGSRRLFGTRGDQHCLCAFGALLGILAGHGYATLHLERGATPVTVLLGGLDPHQDPATQDLTPALRQLDETGAVSGPWPLDSAFPEEIAVFLDLGAGIELLTLLNDHDHSEHQGPLGFAQIAAYLGQGGAA